MQQQTLQTVCQLLTLVGVILTALGGYGAYHFGRALDRQRDAHAEARETGLRTTLDGVVEGNRKLEEGNRSLQEKLAPFEDIAHRLYPGIEGDAALGRLSREVDSLRSRATALESKTSPRRINVSARGELVRVLGSKGGSRKVTLTCVMGDTEGYQFASDLKEAIAAAGWEVNGVNQAIFGAPLTGLLIKVKATPPPAEANWLMEAFQAAGLKTEGVVNPKTAPEGYEIIVGSKP